jgi:hypothetical protein
MKKKPTKQKSSIVRSELNFEQNSIFTVSTYQKKSREIFTTEAGPNGRIYKRKAIIGKTVDGMETGVLTTHHFKLYLVLIKLWEDSGRPINDTIHFTILQIIKNLEMAKSGANYDRIKKWLRNLRQIPLTFVESFYIPEVSEHVSLTDITILNHLYIYERKNSGKLNKIRGYGEFQFDRYIIQNLINNHTHPLRFDVIKSFKKHQDIAILLYIYLDRNLAFRSRYEIGLEKLYDHLDLSQNYVKYPSHRKAKIEPVLEQLRGRELSTGILSSAQILKTIDGKNYKLVCQKKPFIKKLRKQQAPPQSTLYTEPEPKVSESTKSKIDLFTPLLEKGLTEKQALKLLSENDPEVISNQLKFLPFRVKEYESQKKEISEPAILYESIKENWKIPKSYLRAENEKQQEAKQLDQERSVRLEQEEWEVEEQERAKIEVYKKTLDPETRAELRERALREIRSIKNIKEGFITDILIEVKENEILRSEIEG